MLEWRANCGCCARDLAPASALTMICSFERTLCSERATSKIGGRCPNCGGEPARHPIRPAAELIRHPASIARIVKPHGCTAAAS